MCVCVSAVEQNRQKHSLFVNEMNAGLDFSDKRPMKNEISSIETGQGWGSSFFEERTKNETDKDHYFPCNASEWVANTYTFSPYLPIWLQGRIRSV